MKYMGSKNRIAKHILPIILKDRKEGQWYVEPFVGGANMIDKVGGNRIGGEVNEYIAEMWIALEAGWTPRSDYTREEYKYIKANQDKDRKLSGYVGVNCSYSGVWFTGYAGITQTKGGVRDYQEEAFRNVQAQSPNIKGVDFKHAGYDTLEIPESSLIYCDPPYANTSGYKDSFNHADFWQWCREKKVEGHTIFISEYNAPEDFTCVWEKEVKSSLSANGKGGASKSSTEKLFTL